MTIPVSVMQSGRAEGLRTAARIGRRGDHLRRCDAVSRRVYRTMLHALVERYSDRYYWDYQIEDATLAITAEIMGEAPVAEIYRDLRSLYARRKDRMMRQRPYGYQRVGEPEWIGLTAPALAILCPNPPMPWAILYGRGEDDR